VWSRRLIIAVVIIVLVAGMSYLNLHRRQGTSGGEWGTATGIACYCLQNITVEKASRHNWSIAIVEPSETPQDAFQALKSHASLLLAYINAGYAEEWRPYWESMVEAGIVHGETEYEGEHLVEYWSPEWRDMILSTALDYLADGYDGVYLDNMDAAVDGPDSVQPERGSAVRIRMPRGQRRPVGHPPSQS